MSAPPVRTLEVAPPTSAACADSYLLLAVTLQEQIGHGFATAAGSRVATRSDRWQRSCIDGQYLEPAASGFARRAGRQKPLGSQNVTDAERGMIQQLLEQMVASAPVAVAPPS
jgi:hypothetical protein